MRAGYHCDLKLFLRGENYYFVLYQKRVTQLCNIVLGLRCKNILMKNSIKIIAKNFQKISKAFYIKWSQQ